MIKEILNIKNISKRMYRNLVLDHISLDIFSGEVMGLIGENGSGKSVLVKTITGEIKTDQGNIYLDGKRLEVIIDLTFADAEFTAFLRKMFCWRI